MKSKILLLVALVGENGVFVLNSINLIDLFYIRSGYLMPLHKNLHFHLLLGKGLLSLMVIVHFQQHKQRLQHRNLSSNVKALEDRHILAVVQSITIVGTMYIIMQYLPVQKYLIQYLNIVLITMHCVI